MPQPPKTDYWMFKQDPIFGTGWRAQPDFYQTLTLLGRQREIGPHAIRTSLALTRRPSA